ncbi:MAG: AsmA family protein [Oceanococcaceae bacterium]
MSFPLKIVLAFFGLLLTTVVGAAIYITLIFDPNDYRQQISTAVKDATGRELRINGDIGLKLFPWVGVRVDSVTLANAEGFGTAPMLEVGQLQAQLELMPLLFERAVRVGEVRLQDVVARPEVRGERNNWEDMAKAGEDPAPKADAPATETSPAPASDAAPLDFAIAAIRLENIRVEYTADGEKTMLQLDRLLTGPIRMGETSTLDIALNAALPGDLAAELTLGTNWTVTLEGPDAQFDSLQLLAVISGPSVPGGRQQIEATGSLQYLGQSQKLTVPELIVRSGELQATLGANITLADSGPAGDVTLKTTPFVAQTLAASLGIPLGQPGSDGAGFGPTQLDVALAIRPDSVRSTRLQGQLDGAALSGDLAVENFKKPRLRAKLELAAFTLEHWTPPADDDAAKSAEKDGEPGDTMSTELPLTLVKDQDIDISARIGTFSGAGITARDVLWTAWSRPGQAFRQELTMKAYGGEIRARNNIDARGATPKTGLVLNLSAVGLGDLLKGTMGESYITGLTQLSLNLDTAGSTLKSMLAAAVGEASYRLEDGSVAGFSVLDLINGAAARLQGGTAPASDAAGEDSGATQFQELAGKILFGGGQARAPQLSADSELVSLGGQGGLNLETLTWDMQLRPRMKDHPTIRGQRQLKNLIGIDIPLQISGPLMSPRFTIDLEGALKARARQEIDSKVGELKADVEEKKTELKAKAEDKVQKEVSRQLDKLFGGRRNAEPTPATSPGPQPSPSPTATTAP